MVPQRCFLAGFLILFPALRELTLLSFPLPLTCALMYANMQIWKYTCSYLFICKKITQIMPFVACHTSSQVHFIFWATFQVVSVFHGLFFLFTFGVEVIFDDGQVPSTPTLKTSQSFSDFIFEPQQSPGEKYVILLYRFGTLLCSICQHLI